MKALEPFLSLLAGIPDPRRAEGKIYQLPHILLVSIFAIVSDANSYRGICTYLKTHRMALNKAFTIKWRRAPAHTAVRYILQGLEPTDIEQAFREHAADLDVEPASVEARVIAFDGKTLKRSFDNFNDAKAKQVLSAFAVETALVLAHIEIDEKSNEIPAVRQLLAKRDVAACSLVRNPTIPATLDLSILLLVQIRRKIKSIVKSLRWPMICSGFVSDASTASARERIQWLT